MSLVSILESGRRDFLEAIGHAAAEPVAKPAPGIWSVVECVEHTVIAETRHLQWIESAEAIPGSPDAGKEMRLFFTVRSRSTRVDAPEALRPSRRFDTLPAAQAAFEAARHRTIELVKDRGDALYVLGIMHPYFGPVNGVEMVQMIDAHARRHADQIREIAELLALSRDLAQNRKRPLIKKYRFD